MLRASICFVRTISSVEESPSPVPLMAKDAFAPIEIVLEKEAPLTGRVAIIVTVTYQTIVERWSSASWKGVAKRGVIAMEKL
jgi:hypothetical protein